VEIGEGIAWRLDNTSKHKPGYHLSSKIRFAECNRDGHWSRHHLDRGGQLGELIGWLMSWRMRTTVNCGGRDRRFFLQVNEKERGRKLVHTLVEIGQNDSAGAHLAQGQSIYEMPRKQQSKVSLLL
jgi:hypothetical protein